MTNSLDNIAKFKSALGSFLIQFSKLEYTLIYYCSIIERPDNYQIAIDSFLGAELNEKRKIIKDFIYNQLTHLKKDWELINSQIGSINEDRRHLIHGIGEAYFLGDSISTKIKKGQNVIPKRYTVADINGLTKKLAHLLTGDKGLNGVFLSEFTKNLFNNYNNSVENDKKIVYIVNDIILTEWRG